MTKRAIAPRLTDIVEAIDHIRGVLAGVSFEDIEADWQKRWLIERGLEIISEASRDLPDNIISRHPEIPWRKVAGIGNLLRHNYERIAPDVLWKLAQDDLPALDKVCRQELAGALTFEQRN